MQSIRRWKCAFGLLAAVLAASSVAAGETPFVGAWKAVATLLPAGVDLTFAIVRIEHRDGRLAGGLISTLPNFRGATLQHLHTNGRELQFQIQTDSMTIPIQVCAPPAGGTTEELLGSVWLHDRAEPLRLERSSLKELEPKEARKPAEGVGEFRKAAGNANEKEREASLQEVIAKHRGKPIAYAAAQALLQMKACENTGAAKTRRRLGPLKAIAAQYLEAAAPYGPDVRLHAAVDAAQILSGPTGDANLAQEYAVQAVQWLSSIDSPTSALALLQSLASVLHKHGKEGEAKAVQERIARLEEILEEEKLLTAKPNPSVGRKIDGNRVALLELFTSAGCVFCPPAVRACDALLKRFAPSQMVLVQYHLFGPLTSPDSEARLKRYGSMVSGFPIVLINGNPVPQQGAVANNYAVWRELIEKALGSKTEIRLKLSAQPKDGACEVLAEVSGLQKSDGKMCLHFALVEEEIRFPGSNGLRVHRQVVRSFLGGAKGFVLKKAWARQAVTVERAALVQGLKKHLDGAVDTAGEPPEGGWPLDLKRLKVIAFVQYEASQEVVQAAQVDLPEMK